MMRKSFNTFLFISLALFVLGYPVLARYYNSSQTHGNLSPGLWNGTKEYPPVYLEGYFFKLPKSGSKGFRTPPASKPEPAPQVAPALMLINKNNGLPAAYVPLNMKVPKIPFSFTEDLPHKRMTAEAASALEKLFAQARKEHIVLVGVSAYRSYEYQKLVHQRNIRTIGRKAAMKASAPPGHSEHQTGLAIDISTPYLHYKLDEKFGDTKAGRWLAANASKFGFIIRYPEGKEEITGYQYEPWHLRYVGEEHSREIAKKDITLEEYLAKEEPLLKKEHLAKLN